MKIKKSFVLGMGLPVAALALSGMIPIQADAQPPAKRMAPMCVCKVVMSPNGKLMKLRPAMRRNLQLTASDANLLMRARLVKRGKHKVTVGKIETIKKQNHNNYRIQLLKGDKVVRTMMLNGKTGRMKPIS